MRVFRGSFIIVYVVDISDLLDLEVMMMTEWDYE